MNPKVSKYKDYSASEYVLDGDFIAWCKGWPGADGDLWPTVQETYPEQEKNIADAKDFILHVTLREQVPTAGQLQKIWQGIEYDLQQTKAQKNVRSLSWLRVAAAVVIVVGAVTMAYYVTTREKEIKTQYAEIRQIELPDRSKITLNANSVVRYAKEWNTNKTREVWLTGEAFFEINHLHKDTGAIKPGERFIVHADGVDIEVLGTTFNVNNRHDKAQITLTSGSIVLKFHDSALSEVVMKPGDVVKYAKAPQSIEKLIANPGTVTAWKDRHWTFDNSSLKEVLQLVKDNYGLEAVVEDPELWKKTISGTISSDNIEILVNGLSVLLDIQIEHKDKTLLLKNK